jgi:hypothetical protein
MPVRSCEPVHTSRACHRARVCAARWLIRASVLICPDGQFVDSPVQPYFEKYLASRLTQITSYPSSSRPSEGRIMIVTDVGHGMRWTRQRRARDVMAGRVSLETCERSNGAQTNDANADGKTVWSWHPLLVLNWRRCVGPTGLRQAFIRR